MNLPNGGAPGFLALSPDGRRLAFVAKGSGALQELYMRSLDSAEVHPLEGTEGARTPFWSPDSRFIGFFADGHLKIIPAAGGPAVSLCGETGRNGGGAWSRAGVILFGGGGKLHRVSAAGGPCAVMSLGDESFGGEYPEFLPDATHFLIYGGSVGDPSTFGTYLASLDGAKPRKILNDLSSALYAPPTSVKGLAHILFLRGSTLMAQPFDPNRLGAVGDPFTVASPASQSWNRPQANASAAPNGTLVYASSSPPEVQPTWFDRNGKELGKAGEPGNRVGIALSPNANRAFIADRGATSGLPGILLLDLIQHSESRLTRSSKTEDQAVWSPDGTRLVYSSLEGRALNLYIRDLDGGGPETRLLPPSENGRTPSDWSRDGRFLIYTEIDPKTRGDIWYLPDPGNPDGKPVKFLATDANESQGQLSPDGRWLAYFSDEGGTNGIYIRAFPSGNGVMRIADRAVEPRWSSRGYELFYRLIGDSLDSITLMAVQFQAAASGPLRIGAARKILEVPARGVVPELNLFQYSPHPDGKRFLVNVDTTPPNPEIGVITNWQKLASGSGR